MARTGKDGSVEEKSELQCLVFRKGRWEVFEAHVGLRVRRRCMFYLDHFPRTGGYQDFPETHLPRPFPPR